MGACLNPSVHRVDERYGASRLLREGTPNVPEGRGMPWFTAIGPHAVQGQWSRHITQAAKNIAFDACLPTQATASLMRIKRQTFILNGFRMKRCLGINEYTR